MSPVFILCKWVNKGQFSLRSTMSQLKQKKYECGKTATDTTTVKTYLINHNSTGSWILKCYSFIETKSQVSCHVFAQTIFSNTAYQPPKCHAKLTFLLHSDDMLLFAGRNGLCCVPNRRSCCSVNGIPHCGSVWSVSQFVEMYVINVWTCCRCPGTCLFAKT